MRSVIGIGRCLHVNGQLQLEAPGLDVPLAVGPSLTGAPVPLDHPQLQPGCLVDFRGELPNVVGNFDAPLCSFNLLTPATDRQPSDFLVVVKGGVTSEPQPPNPDRNISFWSVGLIYHTIPNQPKSGSFIKLRVDGEPGTGNSHLLPQFRSLSVPDGQKALQVLAVGKLRTYAAKSDSGSRSYLELVCLEKLNGGGYKPPTAIASSFDPAEVEPADITEEVPF